MKKAFLLLITFFMGITFHELGAITIHNKSTKLIFFYSKHGDCWGNCPDPYGATPETCCAAKIIPPQSSAVLNTGDGGGAGIVGHYPSHSYLHASYKDTGKDSKTGGKEIIWDAGDPAWDAVKTFPDDFGVSATDKAWLMPKPAPRYPPTPASKYISKGSFYIITNKSPEATTTPYAEIPAKTGKIDVSKIKAGGMPFTGDPITFTSKSATYTFSFDKTTNVMTITGALKAPKETTYKAQLFLAPLFTSTEKGGVRLASYWISLDITSNFMPTISRIGYDMNTPQGFKMSETPAADFIKENIINVIQTQTTAKK